MVRVPESIFQEDLLALIDRYNQDPLWHGILVQLPLPAHIDDEEILLAIDPNKDVDGFHPLNMGHLWAGNPVMVPSTPAGIMEMFREYDIDVEGKNAVVIGRSKHRGETDGPASLSKKCNGDLDPFADSSFGKNC